MKKRHEQKLIVLSLALVLAFNVPLIMIFNISGAIWGIPVLYFAIFSLWLFSIIIALIVFQRHYDE